MRIYMINVYDQSFVYEKLYRKISQMDMHKNMQYLCRCKTTQYFFLDEQVME